MVRRAGAWGLVGLGCWFSACCCDDDEFEAKQACNEVTVSVSTTLARCGLPGLSNVDVCGEVCDNISSCNDKVDVAACKAAIEGLACDQLKDASGAVVVMQTVRGFAVCADVLEKLGKSCSSSDDDDWD